MKTAMALAGLSAALLSGCQYAAQTRHEGLAFGAGDAIAANSAMQIVDPWPWGVERTNLSVPAERERYLPEDAARNEEGVTRAQGVQTPAMQ